MADAGDVRGREHGAAPPQPKRTVRGPVNPRGLERIEHIPVQRLRYTDLPNHPRPAEAQSAAREAAPKLLALPWELFRDGHVWLFQGKRFAHPLSGEYSCKST